MSDFRLVWIKNKILSLLGIDDETLWTNMIVRNNNYVYKKLLHFIECNSSIDGLTSERIFVVSKRRYPKRYTKEIFYRKIITRIKHFTRNVERKVSKTKPKKRSVKRSGQISKIIKTPPQRTKAITLNAKPVNLGIRGATHRRTKKSARSTRRKTEALSTGIEIFKLAINECGKIKKMFTKTKTHYQLHGHFNYPKPFVDDTVFAYVLKKSTSPIPLFDTYNEAEAELPGYFQIGRTDGKFSRGFLATQGAHYACIKRCLMDPSYVTKEHAGSWKERDKALSNIVCPVEMLPKSPQLRGCQEISECTGFKKINKLLLKKKILRLQSDIERYDIENPSNYISQKEQLVTYNEIQKWNDVLLPSLDINFFNLIRKHGINRRIQIKYLKEDQSFRKMLFVSAVNWTNYINDICILIEDVDLGKDIQQLYDSSMNAYMLIWPILAQIKGASIIRNMIQILKCTNKNCYIHFLEAKKRLNLNFRCHYHTALLLQPFLDDIKTLAKCENLHLVENMWSNLNIFFSMLRIIYSTENSSFNQLTSSEESKRFSVGNVISNIYKKITPTFLRQCEKLFCENWKLPKKDLKNLRHLCKKLTDFLSRYTEFVDNQFSNCPCVEKTEREEFAVYIDTVAEHCSRFNLMVKVLRYFEQILVIKFPSKPRMMVFQNTLKRNIRDISKQIFSLNINIFDVDPIENALLNEWFWKAIRQLSVVVIDFIDLAFDNLATSQETLKYLRYHERSNIKFFLRDKLMSKYPKIMDKYIEEAGEFQDMLVRSCPTPPRILLFPVYTNNLYYVRYNASLSYGMFRSITKEPSVAIANETNQGELWKEFNDQAAANLEHFYIRQFMKKIKEYFIGNICNTKCLKIIQEQNESFLRNVCYDMKNLDQVHTTWTESYGDALMVELDLKFAINFDERYYTFLSEVNHLQAIGYRLPEEFNVLPQMNLIMKKLKVMTLTLMKYDHLYIDIPRHHKYTIYLKIARYFHLRFIKNCQQNIAKKMIQLEWEIYGTQSGHHKHFAVFYSKIERTFKKLLVNYTHLPRWLNHSVLNVPRMLGERYISSSTYCKSLIRQKQVNWYDKLDSVHFRPRKYQIECGDYLSNWLKAISSNENYCQEEGTFLNSLYTAPRSLLQIKNENIRKRANKVKFARAPLSEDHIDYSAFNTAWQNESGQHLDRLLTIDGVVNSVVHFLDQIADYTEGMIKHVIQFIFIFYFIFQSIFDVNALTLYSIKESYFPNKRQKRLLTIDDSDELFYFSKDKLPISPDHLLDDVKDLNSNDILFKNELIPSVEDNIKAGNITEDYYSSTLDSSASYRGNRYFKDWCKMSNDVGETDLEELGLHQISHYAESEEEFDKEYYMIKKGDLNKQGQRNLMKFKSSKNKEAKGETAKMNMAVRRLHRYSYIIGKKKVLKPHLEIQKSVKFFENFNKCRVSFTQNGYEVLKAKVVRLVNEFERKFLECERRYYLEGPLSEQMDWNEVMELQEEFFRNYGECIWKKIDIAEAENELTEIEEAISTLPESFKPRQVCTKITKTVQNCDQLLQLILNYLRRPSVRERHWERIFAVSAQRKSDENILQLMLIELYKMRLYYLTTDIQEIVEEADLEYSLQKFMIQCTEFWSNYLFDTTNHCVEVVNEGPHGDGNVRGKRKIKRGKTISNFEPIKTALDDYLTTLQVKQTFQCAVIHCTSIIRWKDELSRCVDVINELEKTQNSLIILEQILCRNVFNKTKAIQLFMDVDAGFHKIFINIDGFVSREDSEGEKIIMGMISSEQEILYFGSTIDLKDSTEELMAKSLRFMKCGLKTQIMQCTYDLTNEDSPDCDVTWMRNNLGVASLSAHFVRWTQDVEDSFKKQLDLTRLRSKVRRQFDSIQNLLRSDAISQTDRDKFVLYYLFFSQIREVFESLLQEKVRSDNDFGWIKHLRYYWDRENDSLIIKQCAAVFHYGFEYMGLNRQFVATPVTNRIYLAMTQAISKHLGSAIVGSPGVGKTETIKNLARIMVCVCNETIEHSAIASKLTGCCMTGSWILLDKINRLTKYVQNLITTDIQRIFGILSGKIRKKDIVDVKFALFVSINIPSYGTSDFNPQLEKHLRMISYVYPDLNKICESLLCTEGFCNSENHARKIMCVFRLGQAGIIDRHYGAFNVKELVTLIKTAGSFKMQWPNVAEEAVIVSAISFTYSPKVTEDTLMPLIINHLFPEIPPVDLKDTILTKKIKSVISEKQYVYVPAQVNKVCELYSLIQRHHSAIVVGPTLVGKSLIINLMTTIDGEQDASTRRVIVNPKVDTYGSQEALAFLKVLIERHSTDDFSVHWRHCKNFSIFGTVTWNSETAKIDRRLLSLFSIFYTEPINKDRIEHIFNVMLKHHTSQFDQDVRNLVPELVQITSKILKFLLQYNSTYEPLQLTLKVEVMENLSKIHRVLQISGGNMILVSPRSYGKWTLTKLAAFIAGHGHFMIEGDLDYEEASFIEDIKRVLEMVRLEESSTVLFISDKNFKEGYLTVIDSLLATCSAPWIYTDRELNYIQNFFQSPNTYKCWKMFVGNCRKHLHIALGLNESIHAREEFNSKVKNYSALLKCASMNCILPVNKKSLIEVATSTMKSFWEATVKLLCWQGIVLQKRINKSTYNHWLIRAMECYYHCMNHLKEYGTLLMKRVINAKLAGVYLNLANKNMALSKSIMKNIKVTNKTNNKIKHIKESFQNFRNEVINITDASFKKQSFYHIMKAKKDLLRISPEEFEIFRKSIDNRLVRITKPLTLALCAVINNNSNVKWSEAKKLLGQRTFINILRRVDPENVSKSTLDSIKKLLEGKEVCTYTPIKGVYELFVRFLKRIIEYHENFEEQQAILNSIRARRESEQSSGSSLYHT
ncbi:uncharacterized protein isoform X3 [Rhodnius prolixus]|uniref:uncharacterized protein isoform X3 n=1 Tax=Rhodnius prolixus TaxID=13249 RepID=UPI003D18CBCB